MTYDGFKGVGFISIPRLHAVLFVLKQDDYYWHVIHEYRIYPVKKTDDIQFHSCYAEAIHAITERKVMLCR